MSSIKQEIIIMGKGDQRSRRGKIWRGTFGKRRPKKSKVTKSTEPAPAVPEKKSTRKQAEASE
jgi:30S ribosomal protein S31